MNDEKGKAPAASHEEPPPPYINDEEVPDYERPTFNGTSSDSKTIVAATAKFPPALNGYHVNWKWHQEYQLGPSSEKKMFRISIDMKLFTKKERIYLHDGPGTEAPIMATAARNVYGLRDHASITLHALPGVRDTEQQIPLHSLKDDSWTHGEVVAFYMTFGKETEEFQWRPSYGKEVKEVAGRSSGWKLVRMSGPESSAGGKRKERDEGFTSDGKEVVAVIAHNATMSMTKEFRFAFMGTGLTGTMGEAWEIIAVFSGFWRWWVSITESSGAS